MLCYVTPSANTHLGRTEEGTVWVSNRVIVHDFSINNNNNSKERNTEIEEKAEWQPLDYNETA